MYPIERYALKASSQTSDGRIGFTLVEVLVALGLLGITMVAVFNVLRTCATAAHHARMLTQSVLLAERLMTETRLQENPAFENHEGSEGFYSWMVRVSPTPVEDLGAVHVQVMWSEQGRAQQYDLVSLMNMKSFGERHG